MLRELAVQHLALIEDVRELERVIKQRKATKTGRPK